MPKKSLLEILASQQGSPVLDLSGERLTAEGSKPLLEFISLNPQLEEVYLSNNDLREGIIQVLAALAQCKYLRVLDIVDNNIEQLDTWYIVANFISTSPQLEEVYMGAKMIMGSTSGRHTVVNFDEQTRGYHNTWWENGYYGTGFNEMEHMGLAKIKSAITTRAEKQNPLQAFHLLSRERSSLEIAMRKGKYTFDRDRPEDAHRFTYSRESYASDIYSSDSSNIVLVHRATP